MGTVSLPYTLTAGQPENVNQLMDNLTTLRDAINGNLDATNLASGAVDVAELATTLAGYLGVSQSGTVRRGKSIIATEESRTNTAYGKLTTPDQASSIVLPTDGLLGIAYQAMWKESVSGASKAAIFIGANQLKVASASAPVVQEAGNSGVVNVYAPLGTAVFGLGSGAASGAGYTGDVTTGQIISGGLAVGSGVVYLAAAAGTYDVSVQFKSTSGSVTAKERKLWVWTMGF